MPDQINSIQSQNHFIPEVVVDVVRSELTVMENVTCIYTHFFSPVSR